MRQIVTRSRFMPHSNATMDCLRRYLSLRMKAPNAMLRVTALTILTMLSGSVDAAGFGVSYHEAVQGLHIMPAENSPTGLAQKGSNAQLMHFDAFGRSFDLDLVPNTRLLAGLPAATRSRLSKYDIFRGDMSGVPGSWARITRVGDDLYGLIWDGQELYVIEPDHELARYSQAPLPVMGATYIYRWSDTDKHFSDLVLTRDRKNSGSPTAAYQAMVKELQALPLTGVPTQRLDVGFVADFEFTAAHNADVDAALLARANNIDGIFSDQVGVLINLVETVSFAQNNDPFTTSDPGDLLDQLGEFKLNTPTLSGTGLTHMFTGRDLDDDTIGVAFIDALCPQVFDLNGTLIDGAVGLTQGTNGINVDSLVAAHELGHNFGAPHDAEGGSPCESTPASFLMAPAQNGSSVFSQCSLQQMQQPIAQAACLQPISPSDIAVTVSDPVLSGFLREAGQIGITLDNIGGGPAFNVLLELTIDPSVDLIVASGADGTCALSAGSAMCRIDQINAGTQRLITLDLLGNTVGSFAASIVADVTGDGDISNNTGAFDFNVAPAVDLAVEAGNSLIIRAGDPVQLQWLASNEEIIDASNVDVFIDWSGGTLVFDSVDISTQGSACTVTSTTSRTCSYANLVAGASETIDVDFTTSVNGTHSIALNIQGAEHDNDPSDDSDMLTINVFERLVDLQPAIINPPGTLTVGIPATFSFTGTNNGPDEAQNATFTADAGGAFTAQSADSSDANCVVQNNTAVCTVAVLAVGQIVNFSLTGTPNTAVTLPLRVFSETGDGETVPGNDIAAQSVAVVAAAPPPSGGGSSGGGGGGGSTSLFGLIFLAIAIIRECKKKYAPHCTRF